MRPVPRARPAVTETVVSRLTRRSLSRQRWDRYQRERLDERAVRDDIPGGRISPGTSDPTSFTRPTYSWPGTIGHRSGTKRYL